MATSSQQGRSVSVTEIKTTVRLRDRFRCRECGMTNDEHVAKYGRTLDVHRLSPGSKYTVDGCVTLCRKCHAKHPKSDHATDGHSGHLLPARVTGRSPVVVTVTWWRPWWRNGKPVPGYSTLRPTGKRRYGTDSRSKTTPGHTPVLRRFSGSLLLTFVPAPSSRRRVETGGPGGRTPQLHPPPEQRQAVRHPPRRGPHPQPRRQLPPRPLAPQRGDADGEERRGVPLTD